MTMTMAAQLYQNGALVIVTQVGKTFPSLQSTLLLYDYAVAFTTRGKGGFDGVDNFEIFCLKNK